MSNSVSGYGVKFEQVVSRQVAMRIIGDDLPKMGWEKLVKWACDPIHEWYKHKLCLANISGTYVLTCTSLTTDQWEKYFGDYMKVN